MFIAEEFLRFYKDTYKEHLVKLLTDETIESEIRKMLTGVVDAEDKKWTEGVFNPRLKRKFFICSKS